MRTRPDFRTAMMMARGFWESGVRACGGGGVAGCVENSVMRRWVMYVSWTGLDVSFIDEKRSWHRAPGDGQSKYDGQDVRVPSGSLLPKQLSMMRRFSSSNFSLVPGVAGPKPFPFVRSICVAWAVH
jgi:hypothetical protein